MSESSKLQTTLEIWLAQGGNLYEALQDLNDVPVSTAAEAEAVCKVAERALRRTESRSAFSPVHRAVAFFQHVKSHEAFDVLRDRGLPVLRAYVRDSLSRKEFDQSEFEFILKILAMYRQSEDVELIARAARHAGDSAGYMWSIILGQFNADHTCSQQMIEALRDPLPGGFLGVAYLDMANSVAIGGSLERHPFDTPDGRARLAAFLEDQNADHFSYAHSATAALPFIAKPERDRLFELALAHSDGGVRMEAAWAQAKLGDKAGTTRLQQLCLDPRFSATAQQYLAELGHEDWIPEQALNPDFQAVAQMANWLAYPNEFGRPPDHVELFDTRVLHWPPTDDTRQLWLVKYNYQEGADGTPDVGIGMVGSVTFALFGEATADLTPEDLYGLHCAWELERSRDERAPEKRTPQAGRMILAERNEGF